jgi:predicted transposase YbfD/YdcC
MHCQTKIIEIIRAVWAGYMLQLKGHQRNLHKEISAFFQKTNRDDPKALETGYCQKIDKAHGRIDELYYRLLPISD